MGNDGNLSHFISKWAKKSFICAICICVEIFLSFLYNMPIIVHDSVNNDIAKHEKKRVNIIYVMVR